MATDETTDPRPVAKSKKAKAPKEARAKKAAAPRKPSAHPPYAEVRILSSWSLSFLSLGPFPWI